MDNIIKKREKTKSGFIIEDWPDSYLEKILCPLCSSKKYFILYPRTYKRIVKCNSCNLIYTNPRLKKSYLKHLYSEEYFNNVNSTHFGYEDYLGDEKKIVTTFKKRVKQIEKIKKPGHLLDVGCATGFFMKAANDQGWKVEGNEISTFAANYAIKHFKYKVYTQDFTNISINKKYDLITMWDVIEHFYNPVQAIKKAYSLLDKNGLLVLSTPDVESLPAKLTRDRWIGYKLSDEHLTYFSEKTITRLLKKCNFKVVNKSYVGKHVSIDMLADRVSIYNKYVGSIVKASKNILPSNHFFYINPFDIMSIYAKKA